MTIKVYELCGADRKNLFSPHCWKTRLSLAHKGLDYEVVPTPFTDIPKIEGGATKTVPLIRDGERLVSDSFDIAVYLDAAYPDRPALFDGAASQAMTRFIINWSQMNLHVIAMRIALLDIYKALDPADVSYFRESREARIGMTMEDFMANKAASPEELKAALAPLGATLKDQPYLGGETPMFADYVVFGPLQWLRMVSGEKVLPEEGPVAEWFARLLDMYAGIGRNVPVAA